MVNDKLVSIKLSKNGYKRFKTTMKELGFLDEDLFLKYCVLKTIKPKSSAEVKLEIDKEIKRILSLEKQVKNVKTKN
ncbi:MAG: hypothetical protein ACP5N2_04140 [Candidatus Nanoarchaeia archaeon]